MKTMRFFSMALMFIAVGILSSCSTANKVSGPSASPSTIKGNWTINDIDIEGADKAALKVIAFGDGLYSCYIGSQWNLVQNGNGTYTINSNADGCSSGTRTIYWSLENRDGVQNFLFKKLENGEKPKQVTDGYRLAIKSIDASSMTLQSAVGFEGKTIYINYHFSK